MELGALLARPLEALTAEARARRDRAFGRRISYSPKVFVPVTELCRDICDYCTYRKEPGEARTLAPTEIHALLREGAAAGCTEALLCLGDRPEARYPSYRETLRSFGHSSTVDYLVWASHAALEHGLLPHTNAGVLEAEELARLRPTNASVGLMLESTSERLLARGQAHHRAPDKRPAARLAMLEAAGRLGMPFTTGLLLGIGETWSERLDTLLAIADVHARFSHVQELIVQPYRACGASVGVEPSDEDLHRAIAIARLVLPDEVSVQSPPNLSGDVEGLVHAGIDDLGGISPVTPDFINPGHPWPNIARLAARLAAMGYALAPRLPVHARFVRPELIDPRLGPAIARAEERLCSTRC